MTLKEFRKKMLAVRNVLRIMAAVIVIFAFAISLLTQNYDLLAIGIPGLALAVIGDMVVGL